MRDERGIVLLEVLAAVVILGIVGLSLVALVRGGIDATTRANQVETELADAERLLTAYSLLTRTELEQRLGERRVGTHVVTIQRPERELFRIAIGDLVTVVNRDAPQP